MPSSVESLERACMAGASDAPEGELASDARKGTFDAASCDFASLYDAHAKFVWRAVLRFGVDPASAEDVVQEVFLVVYRRLADFEQRSALRTWIYGIVLHVVRHHRRTAGRKRLAAPARADARESDAPPAGCAPGPDVALENREAARRVMRLLDGLDQHLREVFVLAELEEMTLAEIGQVLASNPNTVASRLRAARRAFNKALARDRARDDWRLR
jgi:RNA polymerase sigma-70 factor (ECF subfamily)